MSEQINAEIKEFLRAIGKKGGRARADSLSKEELSRISRHALKVRWDSYRKKHPKKKK